MRQKKAKRDRVTETETERQRHLFYLTMTSWDPVPGTWKIGTHTECIIAYVSTVIPLVAGLNVYHLGIICCKKPKKVCLDVQTSIDYLNENEQINKLIELVSLIHAIKDVKFQ